MTKELKQTLATLPTKPGVYLHKDAKGKVLYVGKAKNLRSRVRSYFQQKADLEPKTELLVTKVADVDVIVTRTEVEALLLESNFIKQYKPPYNVVLRDDKHYLFVKVTLSESWPRVETVRQVTGTKDRYFGPYTSGASVRSSLKTLRKVLPWCDEAAKLKRISPDNRPCFYHRIHQCPGACVGKVTAEEYRKTIHALMRVLDGHTKEVAGSLEAEMRSASARQDFEQAARLRDRLHHLEALQHDQQAVNTKLNDRDVIGLARDSGHAVVTVLNIRAGRIVARKQFDLWGSGGVSDAEVIDSFLGQYYKVATDLPNEVLLPLPVENSQVVGDYLTQRKGRKVSVSQAKRGDRKSLAELANANAANYLEQLQHRWETDKERTEGAVAGLAELLHLPKLPARIECYDISTLSGTSTVGSMVVFTSGQAEKAHYRRFQIRDLEGVDDYAAMREMLRRRFSKVAEAARVGDKDASFGTVPDLIVIDGGKGQVSAACAVLNELGLLDIPLIGLAKRLEEVVTQDAATGEFTARQLPKDSYALYLLQRIRDEAHRFAITYNRQMRSKRTVKSALDSVPGVGPVKKKKLMKAFGSVAGIRDADLAEVQAVVGQAAGRVVKESL